LGAAGSSVKDGIVASVVGFTHGFKLFPISVILKVYSV
jgi:hypothetical protein